MNSTHHASGDEPVSDHDLPQIYTLVYCSRAAVGLDATAVAGIIECSQRNNSRLGITGLLVFGGGIFFQWLEGPRDKIGRLMITLTGDSRHDSIVRLSETDEVRERLFPDWDMELVTATDIREVLLDALSTAEDAKSAAALRLLLEQLDSGPLSTLDQARGAG